MFVHLKFDLKLSICVAANDRRMFHIRESRLALSNGTESNVFLVHLSDHRTFRLHVPYVFSTSHVKDNHLIN